ncbi:MAG TPA: response regulator transcription factor, partial [Dyella sp.]|uniref:response regulator transcription factor n=1 Tax=Dyella sp. TaxID=1869338 RepID=UPI002F9308DF
ATLIECLRTVASGRSWLPKDTVGQALELERSRREHWRRAFASLTSREAEVVGLILAGRSNKEIAFALHISEGTTKVHLNNIFRKLAVTTRSELLLMAGVDQS